MNISSSIVELSIQTSNKQSKKYWVNRIWLQMRSNHASDKRRKEHQNKNKQIINSVEINIIMLPIDVEISPNLIMIPT